MVSDRVRNAYVARYSLEGSQAGPVVDLTDAVDIHVHCPGNAAEDPLQAAKDATRAGMNALVFKTIGPAKPPVAATHAMTVDNPAAVVAVAAKPSSRAQA